MDKPMLQNAEPTATAEPTDAEPIDAELVEAVGADESDTPAEAADNPSVDEPIEGNDTAKLLVQFVLAIVILAAGVGLTILLFSQKTAPATTNGLDASPLVDTVTARVGNLPVAIRGFGTVRARDRVQIVPQVGGRVISTHPNFAEGATLNGGEVIATLDPADAELAIARANSEIDRLSATIKRLDASRKRAESAVAAAQTRLETQRAEAEVAKAQYEKLNPGKEIPPMVARVPQMREAEANLASAEAGLEDVGSEREQIEAQLAAAKTELRQAQLNLERTQITLPGEPTDRYRVLEKNAEVGQFMSPGVTLSTLYKASTLEVPVPLPARELQWFTVGQATAEVTARDIDRTWSGTIVRTDGQIDPRSRLVNVVVALDPAGLDGKLVPGMFVEAMITGEKIPNVAAIPRLALRQVERVDVANAGGNQATGRTGGFDNDATAQRLYVIRDDVLRFIDVEVVRLTRELAYVSGLDDGEIIVTTDLAVVTDGMIVDVADTDEPNGGEQ
ncbi:MAG: HlyD family efflux transporter periplasmic adaptor subunit [Planctomycetota bacterium]